MNLTQIKDPVARLKAAREAQYVLSERSFEMYARSAWKVLEPNTPLHWNWHHSLICEYLEATLTGEIKRLVINVPPRSMKSILVSVLFPGWVWIRQSHKRFLSTSYSQNLSTKHSVDRRTVIESEWYQSRWKDRFSLASDQNVKTEFLNDHRGHMIATSMGGTATGKGGDYVLVDDPHDTTIAQSDVQRDATITAFDQKFTTRLDNKKEGVIIVVMQRLHEKDLTGHLLKQGGYTHLKLPAEAYKKETLTFPITKGFVEREPGDILHPEREGPEELKTAKKALGSYGYAGQYDQNPTSRSGGMFKRNWFHFYRLLPDGLSGHLQSWDASFKDTQTSDYVVGTVWARKGGSFYLIDLVRDRMDFPATIKAILSLSAKHPKARKKLVEDKANGSAIISSLKKEVSGLIPIEPMGSKEARASAISPLFEAGNVYLPHPEIAPWVNDFIEEMVNFPKGAHDDQVDSTSQALNQLYNSKSDALEKLVSS